MTSNKQQLETSKEAGGEILVREWGTEENLIIAPGKYMFRRLMMKSGSAGGLQKHHYKDESSYILSGEIEVMYLEEDDSIVSKVFREGEAFRFPTGLVHKVKALTDCVLLEVSTPHLNDRIRVDEEYGLDPSCCSLKTTEKIDVDFI